MAQGSLKGKTVPAGKEDKADVTYTNFAANEEKTEMRTGKGEEFDNDLLLATLGFTQNSDGVMSIKAADNNARRDKKGNIVERRAANGQVLTGNEQEVQEDR